MFRQAVPAIWLYPESKCDVEIALHFQGSGFMTLSNPPYQDRWRIHVDPSIPFARYRERFGSHTHHEFLDYDGLREAPYQMRQGWCLLQTEFIEWQRTSLRDLGCTDSELESLVYCYGRMFLDLKREGTHVCIYPQEKAIVDQSVILEVTPAPSTVNRIWFFIQLTDGPRPIEPPKLDPIVRNGFTVVEIGYLTARDVPGLIKRSKDHGHAFGFLPHWVKQNWN